MHSAVRKEQLEYYKETVRLLERVWTVELFVGDYVILLEKDYLILLERHYERLLEKDC